MRIHGALKFFGPARIADQSEVDVSKLINARKTRYFFGVRRVPFPYGLRLLFADRVSVEGKSVLKHLLLPLQKRNLDVIIHGPLVSSA